MWSYMHWIPVVMGCIKEVVWIAVIEESLAVQQVTVSLALAGFSYQITISTHHKNSQPINLM